MSLRVLRWPVIGFADFIAILAALSLVSVQMTGILDDPGVGWHLANGEWIWKNLKIPEIDPFLHFQSIRPWISDQWLSDILMYLTYSIGGWPLIYGMCFSIFMTTFLIVVLKYSQCRSGSYFAAAIAAIITFKMAQVHFIVRPVILSFLLFAICYRELLRISQDSAIPRARFYLPVLFILWANLHPSFVLGLALVGVCIASKTIKDRSLNLTLVFTFLLCSAATLVNPYGISLHESILTLGSSKYFMTHHSEWLPPKFEDYAGKLFYISFVFVCAMGLISKGRIYTLFEASSVLVFFYLGTSAVRMLPYYGIVAAAPLAVAFLNLAQLIYHRTSGLVRRIADRISSFEYRESRTLRGWITAMGLVLVVLFSSFAFKHIPLYEGDFSPSSLKFPIGAVSHLVKTLKAAERKVVLSYPNWGGFILWNGEGKLAPVIDDRNTLLGEEFVIAFYDAMRKESDWRSYAAALGADFLLLHSKSDLAGEAKSKGLRIIYEDELAALFSMQDDFEKTN